MSRMNKIPPQIGSRVPGKVMVADGGLVTSHRDRAACTAPAVRAPVPAAPVSPDRLGRRDTAAGRRRQEERIPNERARKRPLGHLHGRAIHAGGDLAAAGHFD